jgi:hypothetical protein
MPGFRDAFRQGREQARAARGAAPLPGGQRDAGQDQWGPQSWDEAPDAPAGQNPAGVAELQAALQERDGELAESKRLIAELKDYAEQLQSRVVELIAGAEPMAKALRLPGVKTFLLQRFHPDKFPDADDQQRALLTEALKTINSAYALAAELQTPPSE